ncbi:MAG: hypothetical protein NTV70_14295 [Acidobacteria bacterium]|nr:hypothetical protein [Acidobacteriota bacterium]
MLLGARFLFDTLIALLAMALLPGLFDRLFPPGVRNHRAVQGLLAAVYLILAGGALLALRLGVVGPLFEPLPEWRASGLGLAFTVLGCSLLSNLIPPARPMASGRREWEAWFPAD